MDIENIKLGNIYNFKNRNDLETIKKYLEKKYKRGIVYTIFKENLVLFANTSIIIEDDNEESITKYIDIYEV